MESCSALALAQPACMPIPLELGGEEGRAPWTQLWAGGHAVEEGLSPPPRRREQQCRELACLMRRQRSARFALLKTGRATHAKSCDSR